MKYVLSAIWRLHFYPAKLLQLQRWDKVRRKNCLSCTNQNSTGLKIGGLVGLWRTNFLGHFFLCFGGKNFYFLKKSIIELALKGCMKWTFLKHIIFFSKFKYLIQTGMVTKKRSFQTICLFTFGLGPIFLPWVVGMS